MNEKKNTFLLRKINFLEWREILPQLLFWRFLNISSSNTLFCNVCCILYKKILT